MLGSNKPLLGIYRVKMADKGQELTVAFCTKEKGARPKDFTGANANEVVYKLLRKKK